MPTRNDPTAPSFHELGTIQSDGNNRGPASGCVAEDQISLRTPRKVLQPDLPAWIEKAYDFPGVRIGGGNPICLVIVAHRACEPEVAREVGPPSDSGMM